MSATGYYLMHRGWMANPVFAPEPFTEREAWLWLIESAAFEPTRVRVGSHIVDLQRGQLAYSLRYLGEAWRWDWSRVGRFLKRLKTDTMIDTVTATGVTVISITKYDTYQKPWEGTATATPQPTPQQRHSITTNKNELNTLNEKDSPLPPTGGREEDDDLPLMIQAWNETAKACRLPQILPKLSDDRKRKARARLSEVGLSGWLQAMQKVRQSPYLKGEVNGWRCDFDFLLSPAKLRRVLEGSYDGNRRPQSLPQPNDNVHVLPAGDRKPKATVQGTPEYYAARREAGIID